MKDKTTKPSLFARFLNFYFRILSILAVDLVVGYLNWEVLGLTQHMDKLRVTVIGMFVVLILFWFLFSFLDRLTKYVMKVTIEVGNLLYYRKTAIFVLMTGILVGEFYLYFRLWFGNWPKIIWHLPFFS